MMDQTLNIKVTIFTDFTAMWGTNTLMRKGLLMRSPTMSMGNITFTAKLSHVLPKKVETLCKM